jgi:hypothetical protein
MGKSRSDTNAVFDTVSVPGGKTSRLLFAEQRDEKARLARSSFPVRTQ